MSSTKANNDEVIEELTKDLEKQCLENKEELANNIPECSNDDSDDIVNKALNDQEESETEQEATSVADDFVDEDALKELEATLNDTELANRHEQSLELKNKGNEEFRKQLYLESINTYTEGLQFCPLKHKSDRAVLYSNRAAAKIKLKRLEAAIDDCTKSIEYNPSFVRAYIRRATTYEEKNSLDEALEDYKKVVELDPSNAPAREAIHRLPEMIQVRNEKLKEEMLGKLKDLGNMFLKPFGLSTNNFKMQQDPNTGGYSVNFQQ